MNKNLNIALAGIWLIFGIASCGGKENATLDEIPSVKVKTAKPEAGSDQHYIKSSGVVQAAATATVSTRVIGTITKTKVKVGDLVNKGQLLIEVNNKDLLAKKAQATAVITEAKAALNNAEKDFVRFKNLFETGSATQKELDDQQSRLDMAKARVEASFEMKKEVEAQLDYTQIKSPFKGVITRVFKEEGDLATPGMPLISLEAPENFEVVTSVSETVVTQIKKGDPLNILIPSIGSEVQGQISEISSSTQSTGSQYEVKIMLNNPPKDIRSGMFTSILFPIDTKETNNSIYVPVEALIEKGQLTGIYTVSQSQTAILRWVRLGERKEKMVEVLSGLSEDEEFILNSETPIQNGTKVTTN